MTPLRYSFRLVGSAGPGSKVNLRVLKAKALSGAGCSVEGGFTECSVACFLDRALSPAAVQAPVQARPSLCGLCGPLGVRLSTRALSQAEQAGLHHHETDYRVGQVVAALGTWHLGLMSVGAQERLRVAVIQPGRG